MKLWLVLSLVPFLVPVLLPVRSMETRADMGLSNCHDCHWARLLWRHRHSS